MCGIAGFISNTLSPSIIAKMTNAIEHRGPDADGNWTDQYCTLGHRRLSIIDLSSSANQPMQSACGRYVMVYNGEVYNFKEIREEIRKHKPGFTFRTTSDTEIILEAFALWGVHMVDKLNGMFAIAVYDILTKKLVLFRDRIGIKPIYYYHSKSHFLFASELKALTNIPEIKSTLSLDYQAIAYYLHFGYIPAPFSIWKEIRKFPQASFGIFEENKLSMHRYWALDKINKPLIVDEKEAEQELEKLLLSSVQYRLISDVPFGTFLSGGVDSSLVTALSQHVSSTPINTFSIGFANTQRDELPYARAVATHLQTNHHEFIVTEKDALDLIPGIMSVYDEPFADDSALPTMLVSKLARQHVTMTLSGDGGDELFMGYGAYTWAERLNKPLSKVFRKPLATLMNSGNQRWQRAAWLFDYPCTEHLPSHIFSQEQYFFSRKEVSSNFPFSFGVENSPQEQFTLPNRKISPSENQSLFDLHYYLPDMLLVKVDRASMHHSLETRVPILDYRIVEFANNIDASLRFRKGVQKYLLKQVLYKHVPQELFNRPKWGFSMPLPIWMRRELNEFTMDNLHSSKLASLLGKQIEQNPFYTSWKNGNDLHYNKMWQLMMLNLWLVEHLGQ